MKLAFVFGTRPEILKIAPIVKEAQKRNISNILIHTNQHYSHEMDQVFFEELELKSPEYNLNVGSADHNIQTAKMLMGLDEIYKKEKPDIVIVQGDTNSTLSGALAASKLGVKIAHVEAGLRSYDKDMPEEINRILTDSISDFLFPVTEVQENILLNEGFSEDKILKVGNTIVDTLYDRLAKAKESKEILQKLNINLNDYFLLTMHRPSNVDNTDTLENIVRSLEIVSTEANKDIIWPIHPRTKSKIENEKINIPKNIILCNPLGYLDFLSLMLNSYMILTDSGGIQEEACILQKPCLTLRFNTERPETIDVGANLLVNNSLDKLINGINHFKNMSSYSWKNPFGDGTAAKKILDALK